MVSLTALENTEGAEPPRAGPGPAPEGAVHGDAQAGPPSPDSGAEDYRENARLAGEHSGESSSASDDTLAWVTKHLTSAQRKSFMRVVQEPGAALSHDDKRLELRYLLKPFPSPPGPSCGAWTG